MRLVVVFALGFIACTGTPPIASSVSAAAADPNQEPALRLGNATVPIAYQLQLKLNPNETSFSGQAVIDIDVRAPVHTIWLHSKGLQIREATLEQNGRSVRLATRPGKKDSELIGLQAQSPLTLGPAQVHIEWSGSFGSIQGLFRQVDEGRWYTYSDFEATDARAAFPCYDDPRFKTPWALSLQVPDGLRAFSNAALLSSEKLPSSEVLHHFEPTPPLPSYLIAMAAGPFDVISGQAAGTPLRIVAPKGQAEAGRFVLESTSAMLQFLEDYLAMETPFQKLDFIAVPHFGGAMENPGLITFSSAILLLGDSPSPNQKRRTLGVTAHELAHLWFGDSLTPSYWNDLWLSEAFATWLSDKVVSHVQPERSLEVLDIADKSTAFATDHGISGRRVRQPIVDRDDIRAAFDSITYRKGGALLTMMEAWLGEDRMQAVVRRYVHANAGGSVTTDAWMTSLDDAKLATSLRTFLDQTGIPLVRISLECEGAPHVTLEQSRYLPLRIPRSSENARAWHLPVCLRYPSDGRMVRQCVLLESSSKQVPLQATSCPGWILPNDGDTGYYHYSLESTQFAALAQQHLSPRETLGLTHSIVAAMHSGKLDVVQTLALLAPLRAFPSAQVQHAIFETLEVLANAVVTTQERPAFAAFVRRWYRPLLAQIGTRPRNSEKPWITEVRPALLLLLSDLGEDTKLQAEVTKHVSAWLDIPITMPFDLLSTWLQVAAHGGDRALADHYRKVGGETRDHAQIVALVMAMHAFKNPALLSDALRLKRRPLILWPVLARAMRYPELREVLLRKLPMDTLKREEILPLMSGLCDDNALASLKNKSLAAELKTQIDGCKAFATKQQASARQSFAGAHAP